MSESCDKCIDPGAPTTHAAGGSDVVIGGVHTYSIGRGRAVIIIATDVFGYKFPKTLEIADAYAARGYSVVIPDMFHGEPIDIAEMEQAKRAGHDARATIMAPWIARHNVDDATALYKTVVDEVASTYDSVFLLGYCYGGKPVVKLIPQSNVTAAVVAHPSRLAKEDTALITKPALFLCAETDSSFDNELRKYFQTALADRDDVLFIIHLGVEHGFAVRDDGSEHQVREKRKAIEESLQFFQKYSK